MSEIKLNAKTVIQFYYDRLDNPNFAIFIKNENRDEIKADLVALIDAVDDKENKNYFRNGVFGKKMTFITGLTIQKLGRIFPSDLVKFSSAIGLNHIEFDLSVFNDLENVLKVLNTKQTVIHGIGRNHLFPFIL